MAEKNVQIKDLTGNNIYPKTKGSIVINNAGGNLGAVEAGAQVNKIETIKINGTAQPIADKAVDITINAVDNYSFVKQATADTGFSSTYYLTKNGTQVGDKINIAKDMVVESGTVKTVATANNPVQGYAVGDKYIDLVLANATNAHIYILVSDLVDTYTQGTGITISGNTISVNLETLKQTFAEKTTVNANLGNKADKSTTLAGYGITNAYTKGEVDSALSGFLTYEELA